MGYTFRYWFEWGCDEKWCPCLWADDDRTKEKFDYCADLNKLPISNELRQFLCQLGIAHDSALNRDYPPGPLAWSKEVEKQWYLKAWEGYERLKEELGDDYSIIYCEKMTAAPCKKWERPV